MGNKSKYNIDEWDWDQMSGSGDMPVIDWDEGVVSGSFQGFTLGLEGGKYAIGDKIENLNTFNLGEYIYREGDYQIAEGEFLNVSIFENRGRAVFLLFETSKRSFSKVLIYNGGEVEEKLAEDVNLSNYKKIFSSGKNATFIFHREKHRFSISYLFLLSIATIILSSSLIYKLISN